MKTFFFRPLALAGCALGAALALASCTPASNDNSVAPDANALGGNSAVPNSDNSAAANAVDSNAVSDNAAPAARAQFSYLESVMVPGKDDLLHEQKVSRMAIDSQLKSGGDKAPALQEIIAKAPAYYPSGAKINSAKDNGKALVIDLNAAFDKPDFWSKKGEKTTELAVYALVNSMEQGGKGAAKPVQFTVEKKPVQTFGEFDVSGDIEPQTRLLATR